MRVFRPRIQHTVLGSTQTNVRVTFYISRGTDLWYSEACLKAISRAEKSVLKMKICQIVHDHTALFLKRSRHLQFPFYVFYYGASKSGSSLYNIERYMGQASKINFDEKQDQ